MSFSQPTTYSHRQTAPLCWLVGGVAVFMLVTGISLLGSVLWVGVTVLIAGVLMLVISGMFGYLQVEDDGDALQLRYGPIPGFRKRIAYDDIERVQQGRSSWIDGWGIHSLPGRGTTYNLWGRDCAVLRVDGRTIRVGSDDAAGLVAFLDKRLAAGAAQA